MDATKCKELVEKERKIRALKAYVHRALPMLRAYYSHVIGDPLRRRELLKLIEDGEEVSNVSAKKSPYNLKSRL